jgi:lysophospholipase L1-like esterase
MLTIRKKKPQIILLISSILIALFILEICSRIWLNHFADAEQYGKYALYTDVKHENYQKIKHHYLNYYPNPNYRSGLRYHNSLGYRNKEFSRIKPPGIYRIVALGGSSTYDSGIKDNEKTFTAQLEKILRKRYGYKNVEVINAGVGGYTSWESLINLEFRVLDIDPDLVIIYHGTNDVNARLVVPDAYSADNSGSRKQWEPPPIPIIEYSALLRIIGRKLHLAHQVGVWSFVDAKTYLGPEGKNYDPMALLKKNPPKYFRRNLKNMIAIAKANGVKIMFSTWAHSPYFEHDYASLPFQQIGMKENNDVVREVAISNNIPLFDFADQMPKDKKYWADGRHNNERGALLKAELFAKFIHDSGLIKNRN